jgi:SLT domain-containing protein
VALVGSASVEIVPDARGFKEKLDAALKGAIGDVQVAVDVKLYDAAALQKIEELIRDRTLHIDVKLYDADATQKLARLTEDRRVDIDVKLFADAARAQLDALARDRTTTVRVNTVGGDSNGGSGGGGFSGGGLLAAAVPLAALAIPLGAAAIGGAAALGAGFAVAAGGALALKGALSGVDTATKAVTAANLQAGTAAKASGAAQASAAAATQGAQAGLANAIASANNAAITSAQAVKSAQQGVADAQRTATAAVATALVQQESAERSLTSAQQAETNAQNALTLARKSAQQQIEDLTNSVADGALAQRAAALSVIDAQHNLDLAKVNPGATRFQQEQAQLAYDQAVQQVTDLATRQQRLVADKAAADKAGVDGSTTVIAAQVGVATATTGVATAQEAVQRAAAAVTEAQRAGAESVAKAQDAVTTALRAQGEQARSSAASIASAQLALENAQRGAATAATTTNTAALAAAAALAALTPAGRRFAEFIQTTLQPALKTLKDTAQEGILPGLQDGLTKLLPVLPIFVDIVHNVSTALGDLFSAAGAGLSGGFFTQFFAFVRDTAGPALTTVGTIIGNVVTGLAGLLQGFAPVISQIGGGVADLTGKFATFGTTLSTNSSFQSFLAYVIQAGPVVASALGSIFNATGTLVEGLAPLGIVLLKIIDSVGGLIVSMGPTGLLLTIGAVAGAIAVFTGGVGAIVIAVTAAVGAVTYLYTSNKTFHDFIDQKVLPILKALGGYFTGTLVPIFEEVGGRVLSTLRTAIGYVTDKFNDNKGALEVLGTGLVVLGRVIIEKVIPFLLENGLTAAIKIVGIALGALLDTIGLLFDGLKQLVSLGASALSALSNVPGFGWAKDGAIQLEAFRIALDKVGSSTTSSTTAQFDATKQAKLLSDANDGLKTAQDKLNGAVQTNIDKFTILNGGVLAQQQANDKLAASYDALTTATAANGTSLDSNSASGRANRKAIDDVALALNTKAQSDYDATTKTLGHTAAVDQANVTLADNRQKLLDVLVQSGSTQAGAQSYINTLLQVPHSSPTQFETPGLSEALSGVTNLQGQIDSLHGANVPINIFGSYSIGPNGAAQFGNLTALTPSSGPTPALPGIRSNAAGGLQRGPGTGTSDGILSRLSDGEFVVKASETAKHLSTLEAMNSGNLPAFASGGPVNVRLLTSAALGAGVLQDPINGVYGQQGFAGLLSQLGKAGVLNAVSSNPGVGGSVDRWAPVILQALGLQGLPAAFLAGVENVIARESGGNPNAINLTDSNAIAGHPSQGLMQTIPATFAAYAGPYASRGITDPLANIYAGIAYANANYGPSFFAGGGRKDPSGGYIGYDTGGYIPPGITNVYNGTGKPEMVFTPEQLSARDAHGGGGNQFTGQVVHGDVYQVDPEAYAREERTNMRRAQVQYGLGVR